MLNCKTRGCNYEVILGQDYCRPCLFEKKHGLDKLRVKASGPDLNNEYKESDDPMTSRLIKEKNCIDCKEPYKSTSNVQKRCPECKKIHIKNYRIKYKKSAKKSHLVKPKKSMSSGSHDNVVERLLDNYKETADRARCLFVTLKTINEITGQKIEIPELSLMP